MTKCVRLSGAALLATCAAFAQGDPKVGAFIGYDYTRFFSSSSAADFHANGGDGELIYNFKKRFGLVFDAGAVNQTGIAGFNSDTTIAHFLAGPRFTFTRRSRFRPYIQGLFGGVHSSSSVAILGDPLESALPIVPGQPLSVRFIASQTKFALAAGGGLDIRIAKHVYFRPLGVEYFFAKTRTSFAESDNDLEGIRYTAGFTFMFGGEKPKPQANRVQMKNCPDGSSVPVDQTCPKLNFSMSLAATPADVCPGETVRFAPSFSGVQPNQLSHSTWTLNGQPVSQTGTYEFQTEGLAPGTYRVKLTTGGDAFNSASAETSVTVREYVPPSGTVQANPSTIQAGQKSTVSANFQGQCGGPIQSPSYEASEGSIQGDQFDSSTIQWDTANNAEQRKTVTITAKASDNKNTGTANTTVDVVRAAVVMPVRLPDVLFTPNSSRVNNCGKRILLEQLRAYWERDSSGTVVLVGHTSSEESAAGLAQSRANNSAAVITAGTGICLAVPASQVQVSAPGADQNGVSFDSSFCQSSVAPVGPHTDERRVEVWFVPSGGQIPASVVNAQSATTLNLGSLGCPK
jgi:outer membrane protein OmpA-like peptidoglycan-associated protein